MRPSFAVAAVVLMVNSNALAESDRILRKKVVVNATAADVWNAWTTTEGVKQFFPQEAKIELKPGGAYEMYFSMAQPAGQRGSEGCTILSFAPNEMLSFTWNAPPKFGELRQQHTRVIILFDERTDGQTEIELIHAGWGEGGQWDEVYAYFDDAWGRVLTRLVEYFDKSDRKPLAATELPYRILRGEVIVPAPRDQVWEAFTTNAGLATWMAPGANVELRVGGPFEIYFRPAAPSGSRGMEGSKVLTFIDKEVLSYRGGAPAKYPNVHKNRPIAVYRFDDAGDGRTRVRATFVGWEIRNEEYDAAFEHGKFGLNYILGNLKKRFETGPTDWNAGADPNLAKGSK